MRRLKPGYRAALCGLIVLGSRGLAAAQEPLPNWFDLPLPGGVATLEALGISADERAFTLPILVRALHDHDARVGLTYARVSRVLTDMAAHSENGDKAVTIPVPLDPEIWRQLLPPPDAGDLFVRLVADSRALMLVLGLMSTDDSIRALLARDRDLLRFIYQNASGAFVLAARRLRIDGGRVVVPGGERGDVIWRSLTNESASRPAAFVRALLAKDQGRLAWYFDTISGLDERRLAAAWPEPRALDSASILYAGFRDTDPQWRASEQPFRRALTDAWTVITQIEIGSAASTGEVRIPSPFPREVWELLFSSTRVTGPQVMQALQHAGTPVSLPWLVRETLNGSVRERRHRFEMFRLGQRVFADAAAAELPDVAVALSGIRDHRALVFALERMGIPSAATWAAAVAAARHVSNEADDRRESVTAFQGTLALIERIRHVRTIDTDIADRLVRTLSEAVRVDQRVLRSLGQWIVESLMPAVPRLVRPDAFTGKTAYESIVLQALAGPVQRQRLPLSWEGLDYTVDLVEAEHERLRAVRELLPSPGLDAAIASGRPRDLADALTALTYATALGDPDGPVSLSPDVPTRHDFGFGGTSMMREVIPWSPPEERQGVGPWRVQGALLGLDLALSRLALRRIADDQLPQAPTLTLNDLGTLTRTAVVMVASDLSDAERDELAAAIARGRERVRAAATGPALAALGVECAMSHTARQLLPWIASRQPEALSNVFSLRDLLWLGSPRLSPAQLDRWGVAADAIDGRRVTAMPPPAPWEDYAGRSEAGQVTTQVPDLTLRLVEETMRLRLPALLVPSLLAFALEDYWHEVQARFADDWPQLTRQAARLPSARVEDYVAALAGGGPLRAQ